MANVAQGSGPTNPSGPHERSTAASGTVSVTDPTREIVSVEGAPAERAAVTDPRREIVEVRDADGGGTLIVAEPVPTFAGSTAVDTSGATPGSVLRAGPDNVLRPARLTLGSLDDVDDPPSDPQGGTGVLTRTGVGQRARFAPLPAPTPTPQRYTQINPAQLWQVVHDLGHRPTFDCHLPDGTSIKQENVLHPVPGSISEIVFGVPVSGYADPA